LEWNAAVWNSTTLYNVHAKHDFNKSKESLTGIVPRRQLFVDFSLTEILTPKKWKNNPMIFERFLNTKCQSFWFQVSCLVHAKCLCCSIYWVNEVSHCLGIMATSLYAHRNDRDHAAICCNQISCHSTSHKRLSHVNVAPWDHNNGD
jgi:hypothetical protein